MKCKVTMHNYHQTETIEETLDRRVPEMRCYGDKIKQLIADIDENKDELEHRKVEVKAAFEKCRKDAEMQLQKIIDRATEDYNALLKELDIKEEEVVSQIRLERKQEYEQLVEWMETCSESARGATLMQEIQSGLGKRMKYLAELEILARSHDRCIIPKLVHGTGNLSVKANAIGEIEYETVKVLGMQRQTDCRNPVIPFKEILQRKFKQNNQIQLKGRCRRISLIQGNIWAARCECKCIQVIDLEGKLKKEISFTFKPHSVREAP